MTACGADAADSAPSFEKSNEVRHRIAWRADYHAAVDEAADRRQMAFILFYNPIDPAGNDRFEHDVLGQNPIGSLIEARYTPVRLPIMAAKAAPNDVIPAFNTSRRDAKPWFMACSPDSPATLNLVTFCRPARGECQSV